MVEGRARERARIAVLGSAGSRRGLRDHRLRTGKEKVRKKGQ